MSFNKKTVRDIDLKGKTVLLRSDFNVPLMPNGEIRDDYRIKQALPTIDFLLEQKCKIIICTHLGRPEGKPDGRYSVRPVAKTLEKLLKKDVKFIQDCVGGEVEKQAKNLKEKDILLLENLRFYPEEEANDPAFAKKLAGLADVFVQDGFGNAHRKHASMDAITEFLPSVAGLLLEKEYLAITESMENPERPLMAIVGGAKIADKIEILRKFIQKADFVAVGGAMANTFLLAQGMEVGKSLVDRDDLALARKIIEEAKQETHKRNFTFYLPQDSVVAASLEKTATTRIVDWDAHVIAAIENYPRQAPRRAGQVRENELILDLGPFSGAFIAGSMQFCGTVIWNGVMGVTETPGLHGPVGPFAHGTELILDSMMGQYGHKPYSLIGGGDTSSYVEHRGLTECFNHVSTGGGACLELMTGKKLPAIEALQDK